MCVLCVLREGSDQVVAGHHHDGDDWGVLAGFMCDRAHRNSTVAEQRFSRLVDATPNNLGDNPPGRLFVGGFRDAIQWAGQHCDLNMDSR